MASLVLILSLMSLVPEPIRPGFDPVQVVTQVRAGSHQQPVRTSTDDAAFLLDTNFVRTRCAWQQSYTSVAAAGETLLVAWEDHRGYFQDDIYACRVTASGVLLDSSGIVISAEPWNQQNPAMAYDGQNFVVAWHDARNGENDIYAARVSTSGRVLDPAGIAISTAAGGEGYPAIAVVDTLCFIAWQDARGGSSYDIYACRLTRNGTVLDPTGIALSAGPENEQYPALSGSDDCWLAAWQDARNGNSDIYACRVLPSGSVLDTSGIAVGVGSDEQSYAAVAFDSVWLVAWSDQGRDDGDICAARVSLDGVVLDSTGLAVSVATQQQTTPDVSADGGRFLVAWSDARSYPDYEVYGSRVTRGGTVLEPSGICLSRMENTQSTPALARCDDGWFATWHDARGGQTWSIFGTRISGAGVVLDSAGIFLAPALYGQYDTDVAFDGTNYLVVYSDFRSGDSKDIYACRVTPGGDVLDPQGIAICSLPNWQGIPVVAWGDSSWLVVWGDLRTGDFDISGARISPAGEVLDPQGIAICRRSQVQVFPDVAWNGSNWLVAWHDFRRYQYDIYGARVDKQGAVLDTGIAICTENQGQYYPAIAAADTTALVVWNDSRSGSYIMYGARVTQSGEVLDPGGFALSNQTSANADAAFDGTNFLVTWEDYRTGYPDIYGTRLSQAGVVLDPNGRAIGTGAYYQSASAVVWTGTRYAVTWQDWRNGHDYDIFACYVLPDGSALPAFAVHTYDNEQITPAVAAGPDGQVLFVDCGWVDTLAGRTANSYRIWGRFDPLLGIEERTPLRSGRAPTATIIRGVLVLPRDVTVTRDITETSDVSDCVPSHPALVDAAGRRVMALRPGANDISRLSPGVYFVHDKSHSAYRIVVAR